KVNVGCFKRNNFLATRPCRFCHVANVFPRIRVYFMFFRLKFKLI
ncbi:Uncharacterized protein APZ42_007539, partial [Daphnia magna]